MFSNKKYRIFFKESLLIAFFLIFFSARINSQWYGLGSGMDNRITSLTIYQGHLIAGGWFYMAGGVVAKRVAQFMGGSTWAPLGLGFDPGFNPKIYALCGASDYLYAGGDFSHVEGDTIYNIAKWNGDSWAPVNYGLSGPVWGITAYVSNVYAVGDFGWSRYGEPVDFISQWNGSSWDSLGRGLNMGPDFCVCEYNGYIIVGGIFSMAGGVAANNIAMWNGSNWAPMGSVTNGNVFTLCVHGTQLYAGGNFTTAGGISANNIAAWNGSSWSHLLGGVDAPVLALTDFGSKLIVGGNFTHAGNVTANYIAAWDSYSDTWTPIGTGMNSSVFALTVFNNKLIAAGNFSMADSQYVNYIAQWNGPIGIKSISSEVPGKYSITQNYPNPFNPETKIKFELPKSSFTTLIVYDALGREVAILVNEKLNAGSYEETWNATNFSSGIYFYRLESDNFTETKKMILIK